LTKDAFFCIIKVWKRKNVSGVKENIYSIGAWQRFCEKKCQARYWREKRRSKETKSYRTEGYFKRYQPKPPKPEKTDIEKFTDEVFLIWLAGFWEGEGHFFVKNYGDENSIKLNTAFGITQGKSREAILYKIKDFFDEGNVYEKKDKTYTWMTGNSKIIIEIVKRLLPHLRFRKEEVLSKLNILRAVLTLKEQKKG
jgi:hypothetical protein